MPDCSAPPREREGAARDTEERSWMHKLLFQPVSATPLRAFRAVFSLVMLLESTRLLYYDRAHLWFADTPFHYRFPGLAWVPVPTDALHFQMHFAMMGIVSVGMLVSLRSGRLFLPTSAVLFMLYTWFFLWDASYYNNHYYLTVLLLLGFVVTAAEGGNTGRIQDVTMAPRWHLILFRFQISIVYFYGGIAKLNWDWLRGYPVRVWNNEAFEEAFAEVFDGERPSASAYLIPEMVTYTICYGGLILDLCAPFLLNSGRSCARRTGLCSTILFHFLNYHLFDIGVFPFLGAGASVLFLHAGELDSLYNRVTKSMPCGQIVCGTSHKRKMRDAHAEITDTASTAEPTRSHRQHTGKISHSQKITAALLMVHALSQIMLPLRHYAYHYGTNQTVNWTGEGEQFSWRMMLTSKACEGYFLVSMFDGRAMVVDPSELGFAMKQEWRVFQDPARYTQQVAFFISTKVGTNNVKAVHAHAKCSLNGGPVEPYINSSIDLLIAGTNASSTRQRLWLPQRRSV